MVIMTAPGTEKRVDELSKRVDDLRSEMRQGFVRLDGDVREVRSSIASFQRLMIGFFATTLGAIIAGVIVNVILSHS